MAAHESPALILTTLSAGQYWVRQYWLREDYVHGQVIVLESNLKIPSKVKTYMYKPGHPRETLTHMHEETL